MKKYFVFLAFIALASLSYAAIEMVQAVITDCGTVHKIPSDSTAKVACILLDYWSNKDCG